MNILLIQKLRFILSSSQKRQLLILSMLLLIGMLFEMLGLGVLIPALGILLDSDIEKKYPFLKSVIEFLGNPSQAQFALWGMAFLIFIYLVKALFLVFLTWKQGKFTFGLSSNLSKKMFLGYLRQPYTFHLERNSAILLRNIQYEVGQFTTISSHSLVLATEFSVIMSIALVLLLVEPLGAISVTLFLAIAAFIFLKIIKRKLLIWGVQRQFHGGQTNKHLLQGLGGVKDVKVLGREKVFSEEFVKHNKVLEGIDVKVNTLSLIPRFYLELLAVIGLAGLIMMMVFQNKPLDSLLPTLGIFVISAFRMIPSVNRIIDSSQRIRLAVPVINLIYDEFQLIEKISEVNKSNKALTFIDSISIENLSFSYPNTDVSVLKNLNLIIKKGESIGLIGSSGSGKSTLVDVILGLLEPGDGCIKVDGQNISDRVRSWQNQIGYVPQSIYLTDDTLKKNIAFGIPEDKISNVAIELAVRAAQLDEFVQSLPDKLETIVGERGVRLSGGQRQRIGIARALYHDPSVLILDEATSALDSFTENGVMKSVNELKGQKTIIIVAHRLSTLESCDRIYKIEKGVIVEEGIPELFLNR